MRECITGVLGLGTTAIDAHFASKSFMTRMKVFWRMQEEGRWLLHAEVCSQGGARRVRRVPGEASGSCRHVR